MFKNYFNIAFRNLRRSKVYSIINIAGLSIGLACAMLIILYVKDEVSFDKFHPNVQNIYRIANRMTFEGETHENGNTGFLQGPRFQSNVPGIESFVRVQSGSEDIKLGSEIQSRDLLYVDSNFFSMFHFPLLSGNPQTCLKDPKSIVISEKEAIKKFGSKDAVGKMMMVKQDSAFVPYQVSAVAKNTPQNSSIQFDILLPFRESAAEANNDENWFNFFLNTFIVLSPQSKVPVVEKQMQAFFLQNATEAFDKMMKEFGGNTDQGPGTYFLQPFTAMHLSTDLPPQNGLTNASNPIYSYILSGIALFILLIACINFINLTIARSVKRAKEIGIRKVIGSSRKQLIIQFLGESFLLCFFAFALAVALVKISLPLFNELANKSLALSYLLDAQLIAGYIALFLITGFLAGFYPALILSGYKPVATLYNRFTLGGKNYLQKGLVILQFALASFLIAGTVIIYSQFNFLTNTSLGYDDHHVIEFPKSNLTKTEASTFKNELLQNPDIIDVTAKNAGGWSTIARLKNDSTVQFAYETVDESFLPLFKIPIVSGRNFSKEFPGDGKNSVLVNESFVKKAGWDHPLGETVNFFFENKIYKVVGVVKDYHFNDLSQKIGPQLFTMDPDNKFGLMDIRIKPGSATGVLKFLQSKFKEFFPMHPYSYVFKDDQNRKQYEREAKWKQILLFGAVLTIFISCIGLFGLTVLATEKRTKEIGIRKVLGASVQSIVSILSTDFLKLVLIALLIATPLAWLAGNKWLENYPYRISMGWQLFLGSGLIVILIALITVSFQAIKAASANPVKNLRSE